MPKRRVESNADVARAFEQVANLLEAQNENPFRVLSYRNAARTLRGLPRPVGEIAAESGHAGLERLPGIGPSLAAAILRLLRTDRLPLLERLRGHHDPELLFATIPGIGDTLAQRVHAILKLETLEELEAAAHDGRLERVPGFGPRRARAVRDQLAGRLGYAAARRSLELAASATAEPSVAVLLDVDHEYREQSARGALVRIVPLRFNPTRQAWLPILHTRRDSWTFTALYSNTARAHELGATRDWVVLVYEHEGHEAQCTVVTETRGVLVGQRVVRGRELECRAHYLRDDAHGRGDTPTLLTGEELTARSERYG